MTYSSTMTINRHNFIRRNQNVALQNTKLKAIGPVANTVILIVLACTLGLIYLTQVTKTNSFGYRVDSLQQQQRALKDQYAQLQLESARLQALERVKSSDVAKALTNPVAVSTIQ